MDNRKLLILSVLLSTILLAAFQTAPAGASSATRFKSNIIEITSPSVNYSEVNQTLTIEGTSTLNVLWFCLRGPNGQITTYPVNVRDGRFKAEIWLRFGAGKYTIWAGDNNRKFDGRIKFYVKNISSENYFALTPSGFVTSKDPEIIALANSITNDKMTMLEKAKAIHDWVGANIIFDTNAYYSGIVGMNTASSVIKSNKGTCRDYSFAYAAIARAAGIPTRVIYGNTWNNGIESKTKHAWNQSLINGAWVNIDTTWDSGYIWNRKFIASNKCTYFNMDTEKFDQTHNVTSITLY